MSQGQEEVGRAVARLFIGESRERFTTRPCLVCGRHCKAALRIHATCRQEVGPEEARRLVSEFFRKE